MFAVRGHVHVSAHFPGTGQDKSFSVMRTISDRT
jgi:hypothetical protein